MLPSPRHDGHDDHDGRAGHERRASLRAIDQAAGRFANRAVVPLLVVLVGGFVLFAIVVPIVMGGPGAIFEWLIDAGMAMNEDGLESYERDLEVNIGAGELPPGCDPDEVTRYDAVGPGSAYVGEGC